MIIRTKGIFHERSEDAPFIGAMICAIDCKFNCPECFNQHLKELPILELDSLEIIDEITANPFNKGVILSGLEWTLQPEEMKELVALTRLSYLDVMIHTGMLEEIFRYKFPDIYYLKNIYIKFGCYDKDLICNNNICYGVKLASKNQYIIKTKGGFYEKD
ncbi:MAG: 4Fe-4S cluster-binding domain-containing protein [Methanofastidiosum sp.]|jgi:organic radical activating enzyme